MWATSTRSYGGHPKSDPYLRFGILISILLHLLLALIFTTRISLPDAGPTILDVSIIPAVREPSYNDRSRQIVSTPRETSQRTDDSPPRFLAEKDSSTEKEQIRRGDAPDAGPTVNRAPLVRPAQPAAPQREAARANQQQPPTQQAARPAHQAAAAQKSAQKPLQSLLLDDATLFDKFSQPPPGAGKPAAQSAEQISSNAISQAPFSRPAGSGAAFIGLQGSNDYLPNLPDGDITLLNTKADKFAVFVRRVATNVFAQVRQTGWDRLFAGDIHRIGGFASVRAVLDAKGNLLNVSLESSSGSGSFDQVLLAAVKAGARDPNPPAAAKAADGNFHFIFKSRCWSQGASNARTGAPFERRWLLLATGLL